MSYVTLSDFSRLDLRVVRVMEATRIPGKTKVLKVKVDIGGEVREMIVGGAEHYPPEYFVGRLFVALVNLEPKRIAGTLSSGMLLAADYQGRPYWLTVDGEVPPGTKVR